mmetsp:Transcript_33222/g.98954  ORF Transcript_33222/g.98954 Transcript_33222/m.98954 type:complete len:206 (-) Transcript_33222:774-1391(-)|eukprot:361625-Chlamydomonas_euryale.AAC.4
MGAALELGLNVVHVLHRRDLVCVVQVHVGRRLRGGRRRRQDLAQGRDLRRVHELGELNVKAHVQVALDEGAAVHGHALVCNRLERVRLDDLARWRGHRHDAPVEVLEVEAASTQSIRQADLLSHEKVDADTFERAVLTRLHLQDHIARRQAWLRAARLTTQQNLGALLHALLHVHLKCLLLRHQALALAASALVARRCPKPAALA